MKRIALAVIVLSSVWEEVSPAPERSPLRSYVRMRPFVEVWGGYRAVQKVFEYQAPQ